MACAKNRSAPQAPAVSSEPRGELKDEWSWREYPFDPTTEEQLLEADQAGNLVESHRYEFKAQLAANDRSNRELAKELASLAIDGGYCIVGIHDVKARPPTLAPVVLSGPAERVDQISSMRCDPPVFVECLEIHSASSSDVGYLVVKVPPSPLAPHMVDGRYWARDDRTKRALTDTEVAFSSTGGNDCETRRSRSWRHTFVETRSRPAADNSVISMVSPCLLVLGPTPFSAPSMKTSQ